MSAEAVVLAGSRVLGLRNEDLDMGDMGHGAKPTCRQGSSGLVEAHLTTC